MNRNPKEKLARIEIRVKPQEKDKIKQLAEKCNLSISEYMAQRALGYEPITVLPDVFFDFYIEPSSPKPLSPALRQEVRKLDQTLKEYKLLCENQIDSAQELVSFIEKKSTDISALESERQKIYNRIRHPKSEDEKEQNKTAARKISAKLKPLREDLKTAQSITERYPHILELLETERAMEIQVKNKNRERNYER